MGTGTSGESKADAEKDALKAWLDSLDEALRHRRESLMPLVGDVDIRRMARASIALSRGTMNFRDSYRRVAELLMYAHPMAVLDFLAAGPRVARGPRAKPRRRKRVA
jgi:hypothetical protein